ncbi:MAG: HPr family phosphocarrier protein [Lachnospiraceae bacterium]|nr:HPr family phosphocarrier protein [Lachnospiraceae bacterium]
MRELRYLIKDEVGIHARPAGLLAKVAQGFKSKVTVEADGKIADATKLMAVMCLGIKCGNEVIVRAEGEDEDEAILKIEEFLRENL